MRERGEREIEREMDGWIGWFLKMVRTNTNIYTLDRKFNQCKWWIAFRYQQLKRSSVSFRFLSFRTKMAKSYNEFGYIGNQNHIFIVELLSSYMVAWFVTPPPSKKNPKNLTTFDTLKDFFCHPGAVFSGADLWIDHADNQKQL